MYSHSALVTVKHKINSKKIHTSFFPNNYKLKVQRKVLYFYAIKNMFTMQLLHIKITGYYQSREIKIKFKK